ncbi:hypothetical protein BG004_006133 [Podila humilis]|nr:hypothetical protein BG004_006133 [Podila humilis]
MDMTIHPRTNRVYVAEYDQLAKIFKDEHEKSVCDVYVKMPLYMNDSLVDSASMDNALASRKISEIPPKQEISKVEETTARARVVFQYMAKEIEQFSGFKWNFRMKPTVVFTPHRVSARVELYCGQTQGVGNTLADSCARSNHGGRPSTGRFDCGGRIILFVNFTTEVCIIRYKHKPHPPRTGFAPSAGIPENVVRAMRDVATQDPDYANIDGRKMCTKLKAKKALPLVESFMIALRWLQLRESKLKGGAALSTPNTINNLAVATINSTAGSGMTRSMAPDNQAKTTVDDSAESEKMNATSKSDRPARSFMIKKRHSDQKASKIARTTIYTETENVKAMTPSVTVPSDLNDQATSSRERISRPTRAASKLAHAKILIQSKIPVMLNIDDDNESDEDKFTTDDEKVNKGIEVNVEEGSKVVAKGVSQEDSEKDFEESQENANKFVQAGAEDDTNDAHDAQAAEDMSPEPESEDEYPDPGEKDSESEEGEGDEEDEFVDARMELINSQDELRPGAVPEEPISSQITDDVWFDPPEVLDEHPLKLPVSSAQEDQEDQEDQEEARMRDLEAMLDKVSLLEKELTDPKRTFAEIMSINKELDVLLMLMDEF